MTSVARQIAAMQYQQVYVVKRKYVYVRTIEWRARRAAAYREQYMVNYRANMVYHANARARRAGLPYNLTVDALDWPEFCPVFGVRLDYTTPRNGKYRSDGPSLDRIVPQLGYVIGNVQVISFRANLIKGNASPEELMKLALFCQKR